MTLSLQAIRAALTDEVIDALGDLGIEAGLAPGTKDHEVQKRVLAELLLTALAADPPAAPANDEAMDVAFLVYREACKATDPKHRRTLHKAAAILDTEFEPLPTPPDRGGTDAAAWLPPEACWNCQGRGVFNEGLGANDAIVWVPPYPCPVCKRTGLREGAPSSSQGETS